MRRFTVVAALTAALAVGSALPAFAQPPDLEELCEEKSAIAEAAVGEDLTDCAYFD